MSDSTRAQNAEVAGQIKLILSFSFLSTKVVKHEQNTAHAVLCCAVHARSKEGHINVRE